MTTPPSGATPAGAASAGPATAPPPPPYDQNYAADDLSHSGDRGTPRTPTGQPDIDGVSVGTLISEVTKDLSALVRQEIELAKAEAKTQVDKTRENFTTLVQQEKELARAEITDAAGKAGKGAALLGVAGFGGYMVALFLSIALWAALANVMDAGWSGLVVAVLWGLVAAIAFAMGRKKLKQVHKPEQTLATLKELPSALKPN